MKIQITLFDINKKHKPVACVLEVDSLEQARKQLATIKKQAYNKIASKRYKTATELYNEGYQIMKMREYNPDKIKKENLLKYQLKKIAENKKKA